LRTHNIYSLLLVNVDGYAMISDIYDRENVFELIRKNRHPEGTCKQDEVGVDLNRNYGYKFAYDGVGSSNNK
jgi:hypothetical protein